MAVMLRTLGIPARLVNGFQSGVWNPLTEMFVVRASDAHSWVEAWLPGRGWTTFDPTPPDPDRGLPSLWSKLALYMDAAETFWQEWVLGYDPNQQAKLADSMQRSGRLFGLRWFDELREKREAWTRGAEVAVRRYGRRRPPCSRLPDWRCGWRRTPRAASACGGASGARAAGPGQPWRRHPALPPHAGSCSTPRLPEARLVHPPGVRRHPAGRTCAIW